MGDDIRTLHRNCDTHLITGIAYLVYDGRIIFLLSVILVRKYIWMIVKTFMFRISIISCVNELAKTVRYPIVYKLLP